MTWWAWMILGAFLFGAELFAIDAQFYLVFLGVSAALVGAAGAIGIILPEAAQWLIFAALSLISMFTFRKMLYQRFVGNPPGFKSGVAGEMLTIPSDLEAGQTVRAGFRGSNWTVVNEGDARLPAGMQVRIRRSEGLTLYVGGDADDQAQKH